MLFRSIRRRNLASIVDLRGQVDDLTPLYASSDILVLPSRTEGVPLVILEALACARPVVASNVGDIPELLEGCGIVVPLGASELDGYARALDKLLKDPDLRQRLGSEGRKKVAAAYDRRAATLSYSELFREHLSAKP